MNQKNSLGLNPCFMDLDDPMELFKIWMSEAEKKEINDPNALSLATISTTNEPSVRVMLLKGLSEIGAFGTCIPVKYGGGGLDYISYGIIMQELERCDSGIRSTASVQSSLVMFPIHQFKNFI